MKEFLYEDYSDTYDYCDRLQRGGLSDFPPAIVSCAITGANQGKSANPNLPETIDEQVKSVVEARQAGAVMVHIHARNPEKTSENSFDPEVFKEINRRVREACLKAGSLRSAFLSFAYDHKSRGERSRDRRGNLRSR